MSESRRNFSPKDLCSNCPLRRGIDNQSIVSIQNAVGRDAIYGDVALVSLSFSSSGRQSEHFVIGGIEGLRASAEAVQERYENAKSLADECSGPSLLGSALGRFGVGKCGAEFVKLEF